MQTIQEIGKRIKEVRTEKGISIRTLADRCGMSKTTIVNVESGQFAARLDIVLKILNELEVNLKIEP